MSNVTIKFFYKTTQETSVELTNMFIRHITSLKGVQILDYPIAQDIAKQLGKEKVDFAADFYGVTLVLDEDVNDAIMRDLQYMRERDVKSFASDCGLCYVGKIETTN